MAGGDRKILLTAFFVLFGLVWLVPMGWMACWEPFETAGWGAEWDWGLVLAFGLVGTAGITVLDSHIDKQARRIRELREHITMLEFPGWNPDSPFDPQAASLLHLPSKQARSPKA